MTNTSRQSGFTIIELMVTMAVAAILIGIALPAFNDFVRQRTMAARVNEFVLALTYARSEAVRRGGRVSVQAVGNDGDNEWGLGYCVVVGNPGDCADADLVLRRFGAMPNDGNDPNAVTFNATGTLDGDFVLTFNGRGMKTSMDLGRIDLCFLDEDIDPGRAVDVSATGRADAQELECHGD